jgi:uncharacterized protein (DUF302 family)
MNNSIVFFITGLILGGLATGFALYKSSPELFLEEEQSKYNIEKSVAILEAEMEGTGWAVSHQHDLQATLQKHGKEDIRKAVVVEVCNPDLAAGILRDDQAKVVSNMMPCRIAFYEKADGNVYFSWLKSDLMANAMGGTVKDQMSVASEEIEDMLELIEIED